MAKYIDSDKLSAEIKRYKNKADERLKIKGRSYAEEEKDSALQNLCGNLLHFISSLQQEQPEVDLEKEIEEWLKAGPITDTRYDDYCDADIQETARHFAEWQRKQDQETIELAEDHAMLAGMNKEREELMKGAVEGEVVKDISNKLAVTAKINLAGFKFGQKVKIIILKDDEM